MIQVSMEEIKNKFRNLIDEKLSREAVSNWASKRMFAHDEDLLEFYPIEYKPVIWDGIGYLMGVDLLNIDGSYLHVKKDFIDYEKQLFNNKSDLVKDLVERDDKFREVEKEMQVFQEKYPNKPDRFYMEQTDKMLIRKGLYKPS
jgi:hypothetical protein